MARVAAFAMAVAIALAAWPAQAQTGVDVTDSSAQSDFPSGLVFNLTFESPSPADGVRLVYEIAPDGVRATAVPQCTAGTASSCHYELGNATGTLLIPGAEVTYHWEITLGGATTNSDAQTIAYEDTRFDWQTLTEGNVTVWYYNASEDEARNILAAGRASLDETGALLRTTVDFPVKIFYYDTAVDMQPAIVSTPEQGVITLGEVVYSDTAMVSADVSPVDITRHEVAHIVVRQAVGPIYSIPDWLNEGTAVHAQTQPLSDQRGALDAAIKSGRILSVRSMSSASSGATSSTVSLFYGEAYSLVNFLVETYGEEKFADLFADFSQGNTTGGALEDVYGFDQDGLENQWRASVGLPPRSAPTPVNAGSEPTSTQTPASDTGGSSNSGGNTALIIALVVAITAVVAGGIVLAGLLIVRRSR